MSPLLVAAVGVAGLAIGWVTRPVIFRYAGPAGQPLRQACPDCGKQVLPARTLPWAALSPSGRCPACRARIGAPPLAPEITTAVLFCALAAVTRPGLVLAAACWLAAWAVPLAWVDAAVRRLPDALTGSAYAGTAGLLLLAAATGGQWHDLLRALAGGLALAAGYLAVHLISPSAVGLGDSKLAVSLGTLLAWPGWSTLLAGAFAGLLLGGLYGATLLLLRRATRKQAIPFGPFMIAGAVLAFLQVFAAARGGR
jgi:leader peptidase (prepilin peptidase) / N-methyltransferase